MKKIILILFCIILVSCGASQAKPLIQSVGKSKQTQTITQPSNSSLQNKEINDTIDTKTDKHIDHTIKREYTTPDNIKITETTTETTKIISDQKIETKIQDGVATSTTLNNPLTNQKAYNPSRTGQIFLYFIVLAFVLYIFYREFWGGREIFSLKKRNVNPQSTSTKSVKDNTNQ